MRSHTSSNHGALYNKKHNKDKFLTTIGWWSLQHLQHSTTIAPRQPGKECHQKRGFMLYASPLQAPYVVRGGKVGGAGFFRKGFQTSTEAALASRQRTAKDKPVAQSWMRNLHRASRNHGRVTPRLGADRSNRVAWMRQSLAWDRSRHESCLDVTGCSIPRVVAITLTNMYFTASLDLPPKYFGSFRSRKRRPKPDRDVCLKPGNAKRQHLSQEMIFR